MTADPWEEATFDGLERAQRLRVAAWSPLERLAWSTTRSPGSTT